MSLPYVDSHAHLYLDAFAEDRTEMIERASSAGIVDIYLPNIDRDSIADLQALASAYPGFCHAMMGLHPCSVGVDVDDQLAIVEKEIQQRSYVAVGEIGLDYYWDKTHVAAQKEAFIKQTKWAHSAQLPIVIHSRDSIDDILDILEELSLPGLSGVFHCFTGTLEQMNRILKLGFYMGLGGVVTFKNSKLGPTIEKIPLASILLETDAPYLTPHPYRGKRNESAYIPLIAEKIAEIKNCSLERVAVCTTNNAHTLFRRQNNQKDRSEHLSIGDH
jgi:TatD DNase family protein